MPSIKQDILDHKIDAVRQAMQQSADTQQGPMPIIHEIIDAALDTTQVVPFYRGYLLEEAINLFGQYAPKRRSLDNLTPQEQQTGNRIIATIGASSYPHNLHVLQRAIDVFPKAFHDILKQKHAQFVGQQQPLNWFNVGLVPDRPPAMAREGGRLHHDKK